MRTGPLPSKVGPKMAVFRGMMAYDSPKTYEQIFTSIDSSQLVMVTGEQDNTFTPGGGGTPQPWAGLTDHATVKKAESKKYATPTLAAGSYTFAIKGSGDADLYVRIGSEPTTTSYDCRPYKTGSSESCTVSLAQPAKINVMVRGYGTSSTYDLTGKKN